MWTDKLISLEDALSTYLSCYMGPDAMVSGIQPKIYIQGIKNNISYKTIKPTSQEWLSKFVFKNRPNVTIYYFQNWLLEIWVLCSENLSSEPTLKYLF